MGRFCMSAKIPLVMLGVTLPEVFRNQHSERFCPSSSSLPVAEHLFRVAVDQHDLFVRVHGDDGLIGGIQQRLDRGFASFQLLLRSLPLGDVLDGDQDRLRYFRSAGH